MAAIAQLGGFTFDDNECELRNYQRISHLSPRGRRLSKTIRVDCGGEFLGELATLVAKIQGFENAVRNDNVDFRYTVNGTLTHSLLNSSDCASGVRVLSHSYPKHEDGELAVVRTFAFSLQATYDAADDDLVSWQESIRQIGTGGPRFFILETAYFSPAAIITTPYSVVQYQQSGTAVGYVDYPEPPPPVISTVPAGSVGELEPARIVERLSGRRVGTSLRFFTTKWSYTMFRDPTSFGSATFFPTSK